MPKNIKNKLINVAAMGAVPLAVLLIQYFEGIAYKPYYDIAGVLTVCYGHTGSDIDKDRIYSQAECDNWLNADLSEAKKQVDLLLTVKLPETTLAALYSFVYNVGVPAFARSTLLCRLNAGQQAEACRELRRWVYAAGKQWKGLITRRQIEKSLCDLHQMGDL